MRHVENGDAAVPGGAARLARGRLHDHLDLDLAGRGVHPDLLHAGRDRPAVPRVRGRSSSLAIVASAFVSLTLVPMLASRFLERRGAQEAAGRASSARSSAASTRCSARYTRTLDVALRHRGVVLLRRAAHLRRHRVAVRDHPQGLLPGGGHRPDHASRPRPPRTSRSRRWCSCRSGSPTIVRADPNVRDRQLVQRRRRLAEHRAHVRQPEAARRAPADEAGGRGPAHASCARCPASPSTCGRSRTCSSAAARARRSTSTSCRACRPASCNDWALQAAGADARRPDVPRRHQRLAAEGPAGVAQDRPRPRQHARRLDRRRSARRSTAPSASARCRRSTPPVDSYQVIMEVAPGAKQDESAFNNIYVRVEQRRAGAAVELRDRRAHGRPDLDQPRRASCRR